MERTLCENMYALSTYAALLWKMSL